jgi:hypothetical protein
MTINLTGYSALQSNLFVKIECPYYKPTPIATPTSFNFLFSDRVGSYILASTGDTYVGLGSLLSVTSSSSELRSSTDELTLTISGVPDSSIGQIINSRIKGSKVTVRRVLFNANTGIIISESGNPMIRFVGFVNNVAMDEEYDIENRTATNTIVLSCSSVVDILDKKVSGRKTNDTSMKKYYSTDLSMDRVSTLESSYFNFGAK